MYIVTLNCVDFIYKLLDHIIMVQPKFNKDDKVKFSEDHDGLAGNVVSFTYDSEKGCVYTISSKYFDSEKNDMVEGIKICREDELVAVEEVA